ncbi:DoxX family protein [Aquimarina litoralis]|uniref:DoxX family protein n=1 Tax=Aquimarina litoralis TaxID=584605 RepID=UPI001C58D235|nr:DoxX family protein [Aquimarina litoralis]MBW1297282.1 DoxX family protein [Aquimarina litoralis]
MKLLYWISTTLIALFLLWSSYSYLFSKATIDGVRDLGFPDFFRVQLAVLKMLAIFIILIPQIPVQIKEWGYAGIGLFFVTAIVAHIAHKDSIFISLINVFFIGLLVLSYISLHQIKN